MSLALTWLERQRGIEGPIITEGYTRLGDMDYLLILRRGSEGHVVPIAWDGERWCPVNDVRTLHALREQVLLETVGEAVGVEMASKGIDPFGRLYEQLRGDAVDEVYAGENDIVEAAKSVVAWMLDRRGVKKPPLQRWP